MPYSHIRTILVFSISPPGGPSGSPWVMGGWAFTCLSGRHGGWAFTRLSQIQPTGTTPSMIPIISRFGAWAPCITFEFVFVHFQSAPCSSSLLCHCVHACGYPHICKGLCLQTAWFKFDPRNLLPVITGLIYRSIADCGCKLPKYNHCFMLPLLCNPL